MPISVLRDIRLFDAQGLFVGHATETAEFLAIVQIATPLTHCSEIMSSGSILNDLRSYRLITAMPNVADVRNRERNIKSRDRDQQVRFRFYENSARTYIFRIKRYLFFEEKKCHAWEHF